MKQLIRLTIIVALAAMLTACAGATRQETGTGIGAATGAGVGAILGQAIGHNTKSTLVGAGIGAVLGGMAGNQIGAYMDRQEQDLRYCRWPIRGCQRQSRAGCADRHLQERCFL